MQPKRNRRDAAATVELTPVELAPVLDITAAAPLAAALLARRGGPIVIDASKVERLGAQCLQVLLSAAATWKADGGILEVRPSSEAFQSGLRLFGLSPDTLSNIGLVA